MPMRMAMMVSKWVNSNLVGHNMNRVSLWRCCWCNQEEEDEKTDLGGGVRFNLNFLGIEIFQFFIRHFGSTLLRDNSRPQFEATKPKEARLMLVHSYKNYIHHAFQLFLLLGIRNSFMWQKYDMTWCWGIRIVGASIDDELKCFWSLSHKMQES